MSRHDTCTICLQRGHTASSCKTYSKGRAFLVSLALVILTACGGGGGGGGFALPMPDKAPEMAPQVQCSVDLYGDSIMAGNGTAETPALTLKRMRPDLAVTDKAVPGTRLMALAERFANDPRSSHFIVIENGTIDSWGGTDLADFRAALAGMVDYVRAEGRTPILTGLSTLWPSASMPGVSVAGRADFDQAIHALAEEKGVPFADWGSVRFDGPDDVPDSVHPAKAYSDRLVERLASTIPPC